ncbi:MAG: hypothetical protein ACRYHQ_09110 [Janthinobacterium lividum]
MTRHTGPAPEKNVAGQVDERYLGHGTSHDVLLFADALTILSQKELSRLVEINSRGLPPGQKKMVGPRDIYPPDVSEVWWEANDIHTPILLNRLLIGELRAFGDRDRAGAWPEWIAPRAWKDLKRDPNNGGRFEGGGNTYWNVRVVPLGVVLRDLSTPNGDAASENVPLAVPKAALHDQRKRIRGRSYAIPDAPLVKIGSDGVDSKLYKDATDAARALAKHAEGSGNEDSKVKRLLGRIKSFQALKHSDCSDAEQD